MNTVYYLATIIFKLLISNLVVSAVWLICRSIVFGSPVWGLVGIYSTAWPLQQLTTSGQMASHPTHDRGPCPVSWTLLDFEPLRSKGVLCASSHRTDSCLHYQERANVPSCSLHISLLTPEYFRSKITYQSVCLYGYISLGNLLRTMGESYRF